MPPRPSSCSSSYLGASALVVAVSVSVSMSMVLVLVVAVSVPLDRRRRGCRSGRGSGKGADGSIGGDGRDAVEERPAEPEWDAASCDQRVRLCRERRDLLLRGAAVGRGVALDLARERDELRRVAARELRLGPAGRTAATGCDHDRDQERASSGWGAGQLQSLKCRGSPLDAEREPLGQSLGEAALADLCLRLLDRIWGPPERCPPCLLVN